MPRARLEDFGDGVSPVSAGWYVLNAGDLAWKLHPGLAAECGFEGTERFSNLAVNLRVLDPGRADGTVRREGVERDFFVLSGECLAHVEGVEQPLVKWDRFHCPAGTDHFLVGAGKTPCVVLEVAVRSGEPAAVGAADPERPERVRGMVVLDSLDRRARRARMVVGVLLSGSLVLLVAGVKFFTSWTRSEMRRPEEAAFERQRQANDMLEQVEEAAAERRRREAECRRLIEEADSLARTGDREGAKELLRRAIELHPGDSWGEGPAQYRLGLVLRDEGRVEEAAACLERACAIIRSSAESWFELGRIRESQGRLDEALECFEKAQAGYTRDPALKQAIGEALERAKARWEVR